MLKILTGALFFASSFAIRIEHQNYDILKDGKVPEDKKFWDDAFRAKVPALKDNKKLVVK